MKKCLAILILAFFCVEETSAQKSRSSSSSSSSGRTYSTRPSTPSASTPSASKPSASKPAPVAAAPTPKGKMYSSGSGNKSSSSSAPSASKSWNPGLTASAQKQQSKAAYQATRPAEKPKPSYRTPSGVERPLRQDHPQVNTVRRYITHERYVTYDHRASIFYGPSIYAHPMPYNDWYSPFLMGYLFSSAVNANERAMWLYCHRGPELDEARYRAMIARDRELELRLRELERQNISKNANYVVPAMKDNPEFQYSKDFVSSVYNPVPVETPPVHNPGPPIVLPAISGTCFFWFLMIGLFFLFVYVFFVKEW